MADSSPARRSPRPAHAGRGTTVSSAGKSINNGDANDDSVTLTNFTGPSNGGTAVITMTNPDLTTATWTITAPKETALDPQP